MVKCGRKACSRHHNTKFKLCPTCREITRRSMNKRKSLAQAFHVPEGKKLCKKCFQIKVIENFESKQHRRTKLTTRCETCRHINSKSRKKSTTKKGECRQFWINWKKRQACTDCGCKDYRIIEADHLRDKVYNVSNYAWWACNGGVKAMENELAKCVPRCCCCHRIKTKQRYDLRRQREGREQQIFFKRRRQIINQIKLDRKKCMGCHRKVTPQTFVAFDFDHRDESQKKIAIARSVYKSKAIFEQAIQYEIPKCNLLCRNCHHIKTHYKLHS